ncbi:TonB-dependent receptor [Paraglaciecola sp. L3A3]|uniref:TonB-dependent receptor n=1 Tax=Paraglaciecola sp. L3A3 TaxID=2686358 RepID=UPI00131C55AB|nr:TonB-dependent receptor [Paraglaciecola sp. L3A3]
MKKTLNSKVLPISLAISSALYSNLGYSQEVDNTEVIQVSGIRSSLTESMDIKKNAASIQDSIVAEDIGKFPDQNVAESLQRISGVMISRTNGEGSKVTVRGFGPKFNAVKVNNRTIATTDRGRDFDFQVLPSELISGADVIKASRANIAEGSLGAYVNVSTARPLNNPGMHAVGSVNMKYNDLSEELDPKFSGIFSNTFNDDTFGVLVGLSQVQSTSRIDSAATNLWASFQADNTEYAPGPISDVNGAPVTSGSIFYPGRAEYNLSEEKRERTSANVTLQWAPSSDVTHTFDYLYSDLSRQEFSNGMQVPLQYSGWTDVVISENQTALSATKESSPIDGLFKQVGQDSTTEVFGFNSEIFANRWAFEGDLSYSKATSDPKGNTFVPHYINHTVDQSIPGQELGLTDADYIKFDATQGDVIAIDSTIDVGDPRSVRAHWNDVRHNELKDEVFEAKFDASYDFEGDIDYIQSVDFGISYTDRKKSQITFKNENGCSNQNIEDEIAKAATNTCGTSRLMSDGLFSINKDSGFLSDVSGNFPREFVIINDLDQFITDIGTLRSEPDWAEELLDEAASVENTEEVLALYTQANFETEFSSFDLTGNFGARYVQTDVSSTGHRKDRISVEKFVDPTRPDTGDGIVLEVEYTDPRPVTENNDYNHLLPSLNVALDYRNGFYVKGAAAQVITRPSLADTGVNKSYNNDRAESFSQSGGNPFLEPYKATQFDLSFEYYHDSGSAYSLNFFHKDITSFISTRTYQEDTGVDIEGWGDLIETITEKGNRTGGTVTGFEIAGLHYFDYLPGFWDGFGVQANYTYTSSEDKDAAAEQLDLDGVKAAGSGLEGFSENSYNVIAFYEKDGFQARLAYNWRDSFLAARQGARSNGTLAEHVEAYGQFDFSTSYDINESFTVNFEAINLTDENILEYADVRERVTLVQYSGVRYQLGLTAKF